MNKLKKLLNKLKIYYFSIKANFLYFQNYNIMLKLHSKYASNLHFIGKSIASYLETLTPTDNRNTNVKNNITKFTRLSEKQMVLIKNLTIMLKKQYNNLLLGNYTLVINDDPKIKAALFQLNYLIARLKTKLNDNGNKKQKND